MYPNGAHRSPAAPANYQNNTPAPLPSPRSNDPVSYFVPGYGLSRYVVLDQIRYFIGSQYTIKPFTFQRREGYLISHTGRPLTKSQIEDLKELSRQYEERETARMVTRSAVIATEGHYINQPIPLQQRTQYASEAEPSRPRP